LPLTPSSKPAKHRLPSRSNQTSHDGLARTRVVCQKKTDAWQLQQIVVDGFKLMRQRVYARDRESEIGIEFLGDTEGVRLNADPKNLSIAVVGEVGLLNLKLLEISGGEGHLPKAFGVYSAQPNNPRARSVLTNGLDAHRLAEKRACYDLSINQWQRLDFCGGFRHPDYSLNTLVQSKPVVLSGSLPEVL
jgi:hypothetical protein